MKKIITFLIILFILNIINAQNKTKKFVLVFITKTNDTISLSNNDYILTDQMSITIKSQLKLNQLRNKEINNSFLCENDSIISPIHLCDLLDATCDFMYYFNSNKNKIISKKEDSINCNFFLYNKLLLAHKKSIFD